MRTDLLKGHLDLVLLSCLRDGPAHGYLISKRLRERSVGEFDLLKGTLYPALHRLEAAGLVSSSSTTEAGRRRRVYRLTPKGRARSASGPRSGGGSRGRSTRSSRARPSVSTIDAYLDRLDRELRLQRAPRRRLLAEVEDHLRACARELGAGVDEAEAECRAIERFGAAATVARHFAQAVAATSARRSVCCFGVAFAVYATALVAFALTADARFADFPQGAPSASRSRSERSQRS